MTITINGATNTITAASGLTIAGNTAVTGTLGVSGATSLGSGTGTLACGNTTLTGALSVVKAGISTLTLDTSAVTSGYNGSIKLDDTGMEIYTNSAARPFRFYLSTTPVLSFNTQGLVIQPLSKFWLDGAGDTYIVESSANVMDLYAGAANILKLTATAAAPGLDNTYNLGSASLGWKELFCDNGTINTSDARRKTDVSALSAAEINAAKQLAKEIGSFKFLAAVAEKGDAARNHIGMTVQRAIAIMEGNGLDPFAYSFICHDVWQDVFVEHPAVEAVAAQDAVLDEDGNVVTPAVAAVEGREAWTEQTQAAGDKYSFRVHELLLFMAAGFEARLAALEAA